jgi:oligopeptide transport system ATP-binding protein
VKGGEVLFAEQDLLKLSQRQFQTIRGKRIAMIFQDPMTALNPFLTIQDQLIEVSMLHLGHTRAAAIQHAVELLELVGIPAAASRITEYPHQFSGGMRQRVMIAMALSCEPDILIADEPTTALDVTIQAQILDLLKAMQDKCGMAIIFITHDLGVVASICDRVLVMYGGRKVEQTDTKTLFAAARHPYTLGLLHSAPRWDQPQLTRLQSIEGQPPDMMNLPAGCAFAPRCQWKTDECLAAVPELVSIGSEFSEGSHVFACIHADQIQQARNSPNSLSILAGDLKGSTSPEELPHA